MQKSDAQKQISVIGYMVGGQALIREVTIARGDCVNALISARPLTVYPITENCF